MKPNELMIDNLIFCKEKQDEVMVTANMLLDLNGDFANRYEPIKLPPDLQVKGLKYFHQLQQYIKLNLK